MADVRVVFLEDKDVLIIEIVRKTADIQVEIILTVHDVMENASVFGDKQGDNEYKIVLDEDHHPMNRGDRGSCLGHEMRLC